MTAASRRRRDPAATGQEAVGDALVVGANGRVGSALAALLGRAGWAVTGVDRWAHGDGSTAGGYLQADACEPDDALATAVRSSACVALCLPDATLPAASSRILPLLAPASLLVETASVKTPLAARLLQARDDVEIIGINPMFSPEVGFAGQDVAAVALRDGPRSRRLLDVVAAAGARVVEMSAQEHDRQTALAQATVHAAILCFGAVVDDAGGARLSTPPQRALMELVDRVRSRNPTVYWHIQADNPSAAGARGALRRALAELDSLIAQGDEAAFVQRFFRGGHPSRGSAGAVGEVRP